MEIEKLKENDNILSTIWILFYQNTITLGILPYVNIKLMAFNNRIWDECRLLWHLMRTLFLHKGRFRPCVHVLFWIMNSTSRPVQYISILVQLWDCWLLIAGLLTLEEKQVDFSFINTTSKHLKYWKNKWAPALQQQQISRELHTIRRFSRILCQEIPFPFQQ